MMMSSPQEFLIHFLHSGTSYDLQLIQGGNSDYTVQINGISYAVLGERHKLQKACEILNSVPLHAISNAEDLKGRLSRHSDVSFPQTQKTDAIGTHALGTKQVLHAWKQAEETNLPQIRKFLAQFVWDNRERHIPANLREFLGAEEFDRAIASNNFEPFLSLFEGLSADQLWNIRTSENLHPRGFVKTETSQITETDRANLQHYLDDTGFSGVVTLSDATGTTYTVCPTNQKSLEHLPFSMNSIAKVFTGVLALMMMPPEAFNPEYKLKLAPVVLQLLIDLKKEPILQHLETPSLLQAMNHDAGFGDYLGNYEKAIEEALRNGTAIPVINRPEDFLQYAETKVYPLDQGIYSNLGILLVALAVQHQCGDKPFEQLLEEHILSQASINLSRSKPANGKFSTDDPSQGLVTGGPSGGYWTTSRELLKLGIWLQNKCTTDPEFYSRMQRFGKEFYVSDDQEIRHNGCSAAGSSFLSTFLQSGVTVSILSDQGNFMADRIYYTIRKNMIEKQ